ncbi:protein of unknown function [Dethiosulfatibacter aminovorans DSM 17477]|uniref:Transcobalamin-like C-terminal domain-containing protein n=1 Tax=Dethiosulfatibacter aminovorans DSM 17477 TaxID=1121476 RepID=A0A1M6BNV3_9FIRM|nr:DUF4430 domain-containing protein [Dethiosulfatibacter aminovorans]SHI50223.1 protein of unknown function [Dethiosulfatibacter aminovorans DSM 17477]
MKINKRYLFVVAVIGILMLLAACSSTNDTGEVPDDGSAKIELIVTRDFGIEELFRESISLEKYWTVFDAMDAAVEIATDHGGGFISGINGLESYSDGTKRLDWFYYVNGICADVGPLDYDLVEGDVIWWDYHEWESMDATNSTVIGSYPEPFVHGYRGKPAVITIMSSDENSELAMELKDALLNEGVQSVEISGIDNSMMEDREGPIIVLGQWEELSGYEYLNKLNEAYERNGTYVYYSDQGIDLLSNSSEKVRTLKGGAGSIVSHGDGLGDDCPLWIISGTDMNGLEKAIELLVNDTNKIDSTYSAAVEDSNIIKLPIK